MASSPSEDAKPFMVPPPSVTATATATATPAPRGPRRRNLTYGEKIAIVLKKDAEPGWTQRSLAMWAKEQFRLASKPTQATISNLLRAREKLLAATVSPDFRSARRVTHPELDARMVQWVLAKLEGDATITRSAIQLQAVQLAREMQLTTKLSFSKGWVSSFMNRHQLNYSRKQSAGDKATEVDRLHHHLALTTSLQAPSQSPQPAEDGGTSDSNRVEAPTAPAPATKTSNSPVRLGKRRDVDAPTPIEPPATDTRVTRVLLDWATLPGNLARWLALTTAPAQEPLCQEIGLFLRSQGLPSLTSTEIRERVACFISSFHTAQSWLYERGVTYPRGVTHATTEQQEAKTRVLQLCEHYEALVPVLTGTRTEQSGERQGTRGAMHGGVGAAQANTETETGPKPSKKPRRRDYDSNNGSGSGSGSILSSSVERLAVDEEQRRRLFDLECERLKSDIEAKNIQLRVEKMLARKKLLDAGISQDEVDRIFPL